MQNSPRVGPASGDTLLDSHGRLARLLGPDAEPVEVLRRAEEHRQYWRPERVKVLLLAESHVYTTSRELERTIVFPASAPRDLPHGFVRLVYCLGYGENHLLDRPIEWPKNSGTPQFWKIFYSCANAIGTNEDFGSVLISKTPPAERIANKLALLRRLRDLGVWLLDASPAALYSPGGGTPPRATSTACLEVGWDYHVRQAIADAAPKQIICIGKGVDAALADRLSKVGAEVTVLPQPNARISSADHHGSWLTYNRIVRAANRMA